VFILVIFNIVTGLFRYRFTIFQFVLCLFLYFPFRHCFFELFLYVLVFHFDKSLGSLNHSPCIVSFFLSLLLDSLGLTVFLLTLVCCHSHNRILPTGWVYLLTVLETDAPHPGVSRFCFSWGLSSQLAVPIFLLCPLITLPLCTVSMS
jgi:hypothetical protein